MLRVSLKTAYVVPKANTMHHAVISLRMILFGIFKFILNQSFIIKTSIIVSIIIAQMQVEGLPPTDPSF